MIILDTNVISDLISPRPSRNVLNWIDQMPASMLYTTSITVAELLSGISRLPAGSKKRNLTEVVSDILETEFEEKILPFDSESAIAYAEITTERFRAGRPIHVQDAQIAAIVRSTRSRAIATRNVRDFEATGISIINPWL